MEYDDLKSHGMEAVTTSKRHARRLKAAIYAVGGFLLCVVSYLILATNMSGYHPILEGLTSVRESTHVTSTTKICPTTQPLQASPPSSINLWAPLSASEITDIYNFLITPSLNLNLTAVDAKTNDNSIFLIESHPPSKSLALNYLSSRPIGVAHPPDRHARVIIHHGAWERPVVKNYLIGPLPISNKTVLKELDGVYHVSEIPYNSRGIVVKNELGKLLGTVMTPLAEAMQALLGGVAVGMQNDTLVAGASAPWSFDGSFRRTWLSLKRNVAGSWLNPLNFYLYVDMSGTDVDQWKVLKLVYDAQVFTSVSSFLDAFRNGTLTPLPHRDMPSQPSSSWSSRRRPNTTRDLDLDHLPGPRSVSFHGLRFRVDKDLKYVSWMGWNMYLGFDRDMGLSLWDVRFRDQRILYQLAPQDALAQYAGANPFQATTAWLDRYFGMGSSVRPLIPSYDCPHEAVYIPITMYVPGGLETGGGTMVNERAICVFEMDTARPLTRHAGYTEGEFGAVKGYILVVRSIATLGNYDYLFDYIFQLDGTIEVRVGASGYLQGGYYTPEEDPYGARIWYTTMGSLHDHVINYKVDLDVLGTANSLLRTLTSQEETTHPWYDDDWGQTIIQQRITREYVSNEDDALLKFPPNFQGIYAIVNQQTTNRWGLPRGYAIHPGYNPVHNTVIGSKRLLHNANWARYNLAVSRHKDTEPSSSSMWNLHLPGAPVVDFHKFFDGENITQEDLVAWVNIGMHHLPQAEDAPNTRTSTATSSFFITPLNYFDADVSMESMNAILLTPPNTPGGSYAFDDYGVKHDIVCFPEKPPPFEYTDIKVYNLDGIPVEDSGLERLQRMWDGPHRIIIEL